MKKFEYLKMFLKGVALSWISHLSLIAANYSRAWDFLKARYENERELARTYFNVLLCKHAVKSTDVQSIKKLT